MADSETGNIFQAIPKIMGEMGAITKSRRNQQQNYAFRGIDDVYNACQPLMVKYGVFVVPEVIERQQTERATRDGKGVLIYTTLTVRHTFYASDGSKVVAVTVGEAMDSGDKSANKAMSAAMKYAMIETFSIPTEENIDTENQTHEVAPQQKPQRPPPKKIVGPLASDEQLASVTDLLSVVELPKGLVEQWFAKAGAKKWAEMPADVVGKCIEYLIARQNKQPATAGK